MPLFGQNKSSETPWKEPLSRAAVDILKCCTRINGYSTVDYEKPLWTKIPIIGSMIETHAITRLFELHLIRCRCVSDVVIYIATPAGHRWLYINKEK